MDLAQAQLVQAEQDDLIVRVSQAYFDVLAATGIRLDLRASQKKAVAEQLAAAKTQLRSQYVHHHRRLPRSPGQVRLVIAQELAANSDLQVKSLALSRSDAQTPSPTGQAASGTARRNACRHETNGSKPHAPKSPAVQQTALALEVAQLETRKGPGRSQAHST